VLDTDTDTREEGSGDHPTLTQSRRIVKRKQNVWMYKKCKIRCATHADSTQTACAPETGCIRCKLLVIGKIRYTSTTK
jgi:hypothetical protein